MSSRATAAIMCDSQASRSRVVICHFACRIRSRGCPRVSGLVAVIAYAVASELVQWQWLAHRDGDWRDAAADAVGALLGWVAASRVLTASGTSAG